MEKGKYTSSRREPLRVETDRDVSEEIDSLSTLEPIPSTCNGWGIGNSGIHYFEIYDICPNKVLFVKIGQDAPLFDEESIVLD